VSKEGRIPGGCHRDGSYVTTNDIDSSLHRVTYLQGAQACLASEELHAMVPNDERMRAPNLGRLA
jgi:hypothetical protein